MYIDNESTIVQTIAFSIHIHACSYVNNCKITLWWNSWLKVKKILIQYHYQPTKLTIHRLGITFHRVFIDTNSLNLHWILIDLTQWKCYEQNFIGSSNEDFTFHRLYNCFHLVFFWKMSSSVGCRILTGQTAPTLLGNSNSSIAQLI